MNAILTILSLLVLTFFLVNKYIKARREINYLKLSQAYSSMEMYVIENNITLKNNHIKLLTSFKNIASNPDFLDIELLVHSKMALDKKGALEKDSKWFDETLHDLGPEFSSRFKTFNSISTKIVKLSMWRPSFVFLVCQMLVVVGIFSIGKIFQDIKFTFNNDNKVSYSSFKQFGGDGLQLT